MGWIGLFAGKLSDRIDPRVPVLIGLATFALDMYFFSSLTLLTGAGLVTLLVMAQRGSFGLIQSPLNNALMRTFTSADRTMGAGLHGMHRGVAAAFGVALCSLVLEKRLALHRVVLGQQHDLADLPVQQSLEAFRGFLMHAGEIPQLAAAKAMAALGRELARHVRMAAYADCFLLLSIVFILALIPACLIWDRSQPRPQVPSSATDAPTPVSSAKPQASTEFRTS